MNEQVSDPTESFSAEDWASLAFGSWEDDDATGYENEAGRSPTSKHRTSPSESNDLSCVSDYESLFSSDDLATIELVDWNEAGEQDLLLILLTNLLSDVRDRLATEGDINTADVIGDLVLRLESSGNRGQLIG